LRHPNIVEGYDVGDQNGQPYFTMKYVEGGNMAQKLPARPSRHARPPSRLPLPQARPTMKMVRARRLDVSGSDERAVYGGCIG
jgi:serine/threonine protein kinase